MNTAKHTADAALIDLGDRLVAGIFAETAAIADLEATGKIDDDSALLAVTEPLSLVIDQIKQHQPTTMAGFQVYRLAVDWLHGNLPADLASFVRK